MFFDTKAVTRAVDKATRRNMGQFGGYVRKVARNSMKRKEGAAAPGNPPHAHRGTLKGLLFYSYDPQSQAVIIGPEYFPSKGNAARVMTTVPEALENGASAIGGQKPGLTVGDHGPIVVGENRGDLRKTNRGKQRIVRIRLLSNAQVDRATRLAKEWGISGVGSMKPGAAIAKHPFMLPAFEAAKKKIPGIWSNSVK